MESLVLMKYLLWFLFLQFTSCKRQSHLAPDTTVSYSNPPGYSTTSYNAYSQPTNQAVKGYPSINDYSNDALVALWSQVGSVSSPKHTAIAAIEAQDSSFARPDPAFHPLVASHEPNLRREELPKDFMWGLASSAYQVEGAPKEDGKGPSIWDLLTHRVPGFISDNSTGDVVAEHYYLFRRDIARMKALGVQSFSPSFSWPRFFPFGRGPVNAAGVAHYDAVIEELLRADITPVVTLFHWDTPLALLNAYGGWTDSRIIDDFVNYAKFVITRYDKYVPIWFTINEPQYCNWQYTNYPLGKQIPAPNNVTDPMRARFLCGHYTLLAHAKVAKWYREEFKGSGRISFKNAGNYFEPADATSAADQRSTQRNHDFSLGWFIGPWTDGDYPASLKDTLGAQVLPRFSADEKALIKGSCDFFAVDGYTASVAYGTAEDAACIRNRSAAGYPECAPNRQSRGGFPMGPAADGGTPWLKSTPGGIRKFLRMLKEMYPVIPDIMVPEIGFAEPFENKVTNLEDILWDLRRAVSLP
jgi:beta-glucosidase